MVYLHEAFRNRVTLSRYTSVFIYILSIVIDIIKSCNSTLKFSKLFENYLKHLP